MKYLLIIEYINGEQRLLEFEDEDRIVAHISAIMHQAIPTPVKLKKMELILKDK